MGSCERSAADTNAAHERKAEGEKETLRLAGAGGAAECALMNAQSSAERGGRLCGNFLRRHGFSLQANCGAIKTYSFFLNALFYLGKKLKKTIVDIQHFINPAPVK